ncbi:peroxiredoxin [Methanothrix sp.]|uniref:peroxiredoxin n=1 Tax=Methanothrix sp. TaxID=90426 RepID=UPI003C78717E
MVEVGDEAPDFCLPMATGGDFCLKERKKGWLVLYFYPKDNTSGCTREALDFTDHHPQFQQLDAEVVGISRDSPASHEKFAAKHGLKVLLLSDPDHRVTEAYGAWALKRMYGKEGYGVIRSTLLIDPEGRIAHIWRKVKVDGHASIVKKKLEQLQGIAEG